MSQALPEDVQSYLLAVAGSDVSGVAMDLIRKYMPEAIFSPGPHDQGGSSLEQQISKLDARLAKLEAHQHPKCMCMTRIGVSQPAKPVDFMYDFDLGLGEQG